MSDVQVIKSKCCGAIFSMCSAPECYTDSEYQKELRKYAKEGCSVEMVELGKAKFGNCKCNEEADLFNNPN